MKSTKIQAGEYKVENNGREFHLVRMDVLTEGESDSKQWQLTEQLKYSVDYWNHFVTKGDAMEAIRRNS